MPKFKNKESVKCSWRREALYALVYFGIDLWKRIRNSCECDVEIGGWIRFKNYPEELCIKLFDAATTVLGTDAMILFGRYFGRHYLTEHGYANVLLCKNRSLKEWLNSINDMHDNFKYRLPDFVAPEFSCLEDEKNQAIILHYMSSRGSLLAQVVVGIVKEVAENSFKMNIQMERLSTQDENGSSSTAWRISLLSYSSVDEVQNSSLRQTTNASKRLSVLHGSAFDTYSGFREKKLISNTRRVSRTAGNIGKCPFSKHFSEGLKEDNSRPCTSREKSSPRRRSNDFGSFSCETSLPKSAYFSSEQLKSIFPFHVAVDINFNVIQEGSKLPAYLRVSSCIGSHISSFLTISQPHCEWNWADISLHIEESFEMKVVASRIVGSTTRSSYSHTLDVFRTNSFAIGSGGSVKNRCMQSSDLLSNRALFNDHYNSMDSESDTTIQSENIHHPLLTMKGGAYICDPAIDPEISLFTAFFLISPKVHNLTDMLHHNVSLPDFPRHSYQREYAILGDHFLSETNFAIKIDALNKRLDKELSHLHKSNPEKQKDALRAKRLIVLPVHSAIINRLPEMDVMELIDEHPDKLFEKDFDQKTAFDHCLEAECYFNSVFKIVRERLPVDPITKLAVPSYHHGFVWTKVVQSVRYAVIVKAIIDEFTYMSHELANSCDEEGRPAVNIASPLCQKHIKEGMHFYRRYEILTMECPQHKSESCLLHIAIDHANNNQRVALKFMAIKDHYNIELEVRIKYEFSDEYVLPVFRCHDSDNDEVFEEEVQRRGFGKYPYCLVMPAAERNLQTIISAERIAGRDWTQIKHITTQIAQALNHMHEKGVMHGDLKPLNIMRVDGDMKLIDLDASASLVDGYAGGKASSAYLPPELVHCNDPEASPFIHIHLVHSYSVKYLTVHAIPKRRDNHISHLQEEKDKVLSDGHPAYEFVPATYAHDVWSLGCVLYELCSGIKLFLQDDEDNIDPESMLDLFHFTEEFKQRKLSKISDLLGRNLVSQMLMKDLNKRPNFEQIIAHPFLSGQKVSRMVGEKAEFDVFLSYRVTSDLGYVTLLYEKLTSSGLKVWWDKKCLLPGVSWEVGFTDGLLKSRFFLPVFSRGAVNNISDTSCNFNLLTVDSNCDNFFLELRLALELHSRDLIEKIYPVLIGDETSSSSSAEHAVFKNYFKSGCHPKFTTNVTVSSVEVALRRHLERLCLGSPLLENITVPTVFNEIIKNQGHVVDGLFSTALVYVQEDIFKMKGLVPKSQSHSQKSTHHKNDNRHSLHRSESSVKSVSFHRTESYHKVDSKKNTTPQTKVTTIKSSSSEEKNSVELFAEPSSPPRLPAVASPSSGEESQYSVSPNSQVSVSEKQQRNSRKNLSPLGVGPLKRTILHSQSTSEMKPERELVSFLQSVGVGSQRSKKYSTKLISHYRIDCSQSLLNIHDKAKLMSLLNYVMHPSDAEMVFKDICKRRADSKTQVASPDENLHHRASLPTLLPSISEKKIPLT